MSATLICLGVLGGAALLNIGISAATKADRIRQQVEALGQEHSNTIGIINELKEFKSTLEKGKEYLIAARDDFKNGGHVFDGVPLCDDEFASCIEKLDASLNNTDTLINNYMSHLREVTNEMKNLSNELND